MPRLVVATDGSSLGNPGAAGWCWFVSTDCWAAGGLPRATNQVAELFAILAALRAIPTTVPLLIKTDSSFAIKACSKWMPSWKANGWRRANGQPLANVKLLKAIDQALGARKASITWEWVKGHNGHKMNEAADARCTAASSAIKRKEPVPTGPGWNDPAEKTIAQKTGKLVTGRQGIPPKKSATPTQKTPSKKSIPKS